MAHLTNGWWIPMPYPVNQFTFGGNPRWQEYYLNDGKDHHYETKYDGQCNLGIRVFYDGKSTDSGPAYISYYELGFTKDAKCYSSLLDSQYITYPKSAKSIPYDIRTNAPFIAPLGACLNESGCTISTAWTNSFTNDCGCGDNATDYLPSETQFKVNSNTGFCIFGNVLIAPLFPAANSSTSWECRGTGATTSCTAHRLDYVPVSGDCGSLVSVLDNITVTSATS